MFLFNFVYHEISELRSLTPEITCLMFAYPKSTVRILRMLMYLSSGYLTLLPWEFHPPWIFPQGAGQTHVGLCPTFLVSNNSHMICFIMSCRKYRLNTAQFVVIVVVVTAVVVVVEVAVVLALNSCWCCQNRIRCFVISSRKQKHLNSACITVIAWQKPNSSSTCNGSCSSINSSGCCYSSCNGSNSSSSTGSVKCYCRWQKHLNSVCTHIHCVTAASL